MRGFSFMAILDPPVITFKVLVVFCLSMTFYSIPFWHTVNPVFILTIPIFLNDYMHCTDFILS